MSTDDISIFETEKYRQADYFGLIKDFVSPGTTHTKSKKNIDKLYAKILEEIYANEGEPVSPVTFGTSGWRGILGKDIFNKSVAQVTMAIIEMYSTLQAGSELSYQLGITEFKEAQRRGCVVGFDNRYGGDVLARVVVEVLDQAGFHVFYAGESTTGVLSAAVLQLKAAFSINLTPSHNPLEYGGFKFNGADGGPAVGEITSYITRTAKRFIATGKVPEFYEKLRLPLGDMSERVQRIDSFKLWQSLLVSRRDMHGIDYKELIESFEKREHVVVAIDSVHGASRIHIGRIFNNSTSSRLIHHRSNADYTFGGVAPEPSSANLTDIINILQARPERLKLGAIIDPDGDRIRFTDGTVEVSMNHFGAMAYHFLHEVKMKKGMIAKTVASSNFVNRIAEEFDEEIFEPSVGFKEFKPVVGKALVCFEESDGISIIGHTPEKDAYIGLVVALDIILTTGKNLGEYLAELEEKYGFFYPEKDGVVVKLKGEELLKVLLGLDKYKEGTEVKIGDESKTIAKVIAKDGRKMIFEDGSWLMIRPSGTEPKIRFYVESRTKDGTARLVEAAKTMLKELHLV